MKGSKVELLTIWPARASSTKPTTEASDVFFTICTMKPTVGGMTDRGADARTAHHEAALHPARSDGSRDLTCDIWEVDWGGIEAADVQHLMPALPQQGQHLCLHWEARVVRPYDNLHLKILMFACDDCGPP